MEHLHVRVKRLVIMVCAIQPALAGNPEIRKLKTKVDFFLDNMMDVTQNLQEIRDDVTSLHERLNATVSCDPAQCVASSANDPSTETQPEIVAHETGDTLEARMKVIQEAFHDEKAVLRTKGRKLDESIVAIKATVEALKTDLSDNIALIKREVSTTIADMRSTFNQTLHSVATGNVDVSNEVQSLKQQLSKDTQQRDGQVKALNAMMDYVLPSIGLVRYGTSVYKVHKELLNWVDAQAKCQEEGFHLAEINDAREHEFVRMLDEKTLYWVGGSDKEEEGVWKWVYSGKDVDLTLFRNGEPNNSGGTEHCMHNHGKEPTGHNDLKCDKTLKFVCEKELN